MDSIEHQDLRQIREIEALGDPQPKVVILRVVDAVATYRGNRRTPKHDGGMGETVVFTKGRAHSSRLGGKPEPMPRTAVCVDCLDGGADDSHPLMLVQVPRLMRQTLGDRHIVGIGDRDVFGSGFSQTAVQRRDDALMVGDDRPDPAVSLAKGFEDRGDPSSEPSSTATSSKSDSVWIKRLSTAAVRYAPPLKTGITMLTRGSGSG